MNQPEDQFPEFERQLAQALRRVDAPSDFAERTALLAATQTTAGARVAAPKLLVMRLPPRLWAGGAIAAALLAGVFLAGLTHVRHQREQAEVAQREFQIGIEITDRALEHTRRQLHDAGIEMGN